MSQPSDPSVELLQQILDQLKQVNAKLDKLLAQI